MLGALGEFEHSLIRERVVAGIAAARRRGISLGRPHALDSDEVARARRMRAAGMSFGHIARTLGVGTTTARRALQTG